MSKAQASKVEEPKTEDKNLPAAAGTGTAVQTYDFGDDAGAGLEDVSSAELKIPFLNLLQPLSPQVKPVANGGMPGAVAGMLLNGATGELYKIDEAPMEFIPVYRDHKFLEFTPRALGGGLVAVYEPTDPIVLQLQQQHGKFGRLPRGVTKRNDKGEALDGTEITEVFSLFGIFKDPSSGQWFRAVVSFKSTQIKKYQGFMGRVTSFKYPNPRSTENNKLPDVTPPMWAHRWTLKTVFESNKQGDFYGLTLTLAVKREDGSEDAYQKSLLPLSDNLYQEAKAFHVMLKEGKAKADTSTDQTGTGDIAVKGSDTPPM
jgi:hypothetical protein